MSGSHTPDCGCNYTPAPTPAAPAGGEWAAHNLNYPDLPMYWTRDGEPYRVYAVEIASRLNALTADLAAARAHIEELEAQLTEAQESLDQTVREANGHKIAARLTKKQLRDTEASADAARAEAERLRAALGRIKELHRDPLPYFRHDEQHCAGCIAIDALQATHEQEA